MEKYQNQLALRKHDQIQGKKDFDHELTLGHLIMERNSKMVFFQTIFWLLIISENTVEIGTSWSMFENSGYFFFLIIYYNFWTEKLKKLYYIHSTISMTTQILLLTFHCICFIISLPMYSYFFPFIILSFVQFKVSCTQYFSLEHFSIDIIKFNIYGSFSFR